MTMLTTAVASLPPDLSTMLERVSTTGNAECLNVDGKGEWVMLSVEQYKKLVQSAEQSETLADILKGLAQVERSESRPAEEFFQELEDKVRHAELHGCDS